MDDLICGIATPLREGGIGIIRLSGGAVLELVGKIFPKSLPPRRAVLGGIWDGDKLLDEAIVIYFQAPHSYTGEDVVEIQLHGSPLVLKEVLALCYRLGARAAERGEFTKRAFLNGKLDLTKAKAVMELVAAKNTRAVEMARLKLGGSFSSEIMQLREILLAEIAHLEVLLDFPEDDIEHLYLTELSTKLHHFDEDLTHLLQRAKSGKIIKDGIRTAIVGRPNVGKSSILNLLLGENRAIVSDVEGTTRDTIEETAYLGELPLLLVDTAGIRETTDQIEQIGVSRAKEMIAKADLVLVVVAANERLAAADREIVELARSKEIVLLINKMDLEPVINLAEVEALGVKAVHFSAKKGIGQEELAEYLAGVYLAENLEGELNLDGVDFALLEQAKISVQNAIDTIHNGLSEDFVTIDLKECYHYLGEILGENIGEDLLDEIFSKFCLGK